jgi:hypothetical protein
LAGGLAQLTRLGFKPNTVIDVGVAKATSELYGSFPEASLLLIEPLVEFEPFLKKICSTYNAQYVLADAAKLPETRSSTSIRTRSAQVYSTKSKVPPSTVFPVAFPSSPSTSSASEKI